MVYCKYFDFYRGIRPWVLGVLLGLKPLNFHTSCSTDVSLSVISVLMCMRVQFTLINLHFFTEACNIMLPCRLREWSDTPKQTF